MQADIDFLDNKYKDLIKQKTGKFNTISSKVMIPIILMLLVMLLMVHQYQVYLSQQYIRQQDQQLLEAQASYFIDYVKSSSDFFRIRVELLDAITQSDNALEYINQFLNDSPYVKGLYFKKNDNSHYYDETKKEAHQVKINWNFDSDGYIYTNVEENSKRKEFVYRQPNLGKDYLFVIDTTHLWRYMQSKDESDLISNHYMLNHLSNELIDFKHTKQIEMSTKIQNKIEQEISQDEGSFYASCIHGKKQCLYLYKKVNEHWYYISNIPKETISIRSIGYLLINSIILIISFLVVTAFLLIKINKILKPIKQFSKVVANYDAKKKYDLTVPNDAREISQLKVAFEFMHKRLTKQIQLKIDSNQQKHQLQSEIQIANQIKKSVVPFNGQIELDEKEWSFYANIHFDKNMDSTLLDLIRINSDTHYLVMASCDETSVISAIQLARMITILRILLKSESMMQSVKSLNEIVLHQNISKTPISLLIIKLDSNKTQFEAVNVGFDSEVFMMSEKVFTKEANQSGIGVEKNLDFKLQKLDIKNDYLIVFSDYIHSVCKKNIKVLEENYLSAIDYGRYIQNRIDETTDLKDMEYSFICVVANKFDRNESRFSLFGVLDEVETLFEYLDGFCDRYQLSDEDRFNLKLILEEVAVNIIKHGFMSNVHKWINFELKLIEKSIKIKIKDKGKVFNILEYMTDIKENMQDGSGLGVYLIKEYCDSIYYEYKNKHNILVIDYFLKN